MEKNELTKYKGPTFQDNHKLKEAAEMFGIELTQDILGFAEHLIRLCANEAKRSQNWNDSMTLKLVIDQYILCEFDLPKEGEN